MAAPTAPTVGTIVSTALADAGISNPSTALTATAEGRWFSQIKNKIWSKEKKLKSLQTSSVGIVTRGLSRYSNPSDYASDLTITLLDGDTYTAAGGSASGITLDSSDPSTDLVGREILITAGTGAGSIAQVTAFDSSTKEATVSPSWATAPTSGSTYMIVSAYHPLRQAPAWRHDELRAPTMRERPRTFHPIGDEDHGEFIFDTAPDKAYGMRNRYFASLMTLDTTATAHDTFLQRFETVFYKGIFALALRRKDDDRWQSAEVDFERELRTTCAADKYGTDISDLQAQVKDFR